MKYYTIGEFCQLLNVTKTTLRNWDKNGKLSPYKLASRHRRYTDEHLRIIRNETIQSPNKINVIYVRESTTQQQNSLQQQEDRLKDYCISNGIKIDKSYKDIGSALNYNRKEFRNLIEGICQGKINKLVVFYKDRLVRFGFEINEQLCSIHGVEIIIADSSESNKSKEKEFADDLISIIHYFSMKLYGSRSYKKKIQKAEQNIQEIKNEIL